MERLRVWLAPAAGLTGLAIAASWLLATVTGGGEIGDDAPHLLALVRDPLVLWRDPAASTLPATWQSFPPLLPPFFSLAVRPWLEIASDFVAIRAGTLLWTLAALLALDRFAQQISGRSDGERRVALWAFATLPSVLAAIAWLPQEESYVALFTLALVAAQAGRRPLWVAGLLALTALAGKVFLLALAVPLALSSPRPARALILYGCASVGALAGFLGFQVAAYGAAPLAGYALDPASSVSLWAVAALVVPLPAGVVPASAGLTALAVFAVGLAGRRARLPLVHACALALWLVQLGVAVAMPPYLVWNLPLLLVVATDPGQRRRGLRLLAALYVWGALAYAIKLLGGVALALEGGRGEAKSAIADTAVRWLGAGFPFAAARTAGVIALLALGTACAIWVWQAGTRPPGDSHSRLNARGLPSEDPVD